MSGSGMSPGAAVAVVAGAYLLGSISFSYLIVRLLRGEDVRAVGSGNAGATNVMRAAGRKPAVAALVLDLAKGVAAVAAARSLGAPPVVLGGAAAAVVLGHVFPVFLGFRGGKGVATSAGALGALDPGAMALAMVLFLGVVAWKRYVSLGSMTAAAAFPVLVWLLSRRAGGTGEPWLVLGSALITALVLVKHRANLERLRAGTEPRLGERRRVAAAAAGGAGAAAVDPGEEEGL